MSSPIVSVIIPTYNRKNLAKLAITSAIEQDYNDFEIIVIEDGSESGIKEWLRDQNSERIRYYNNGINLGLSPSRNRGVELAEGKYVAFLDDDEAWLPRKISAQMALVSAKESEDVVVTCGTCFFKDGVIKKEFVPKIYGSLINHILEGEGFPPSSLLIPKNVITNIEGFSENLVSCIDHDL